MAFLAYTNKRAMRQQGGGAPAGNAARNFSMGTGFLTGTIIYNNRIYPLDYADASNVPFNVNRLVPNAATVTGISQYGNFSGSLIGTIALLQDGNQISVVNMAAANHPTLIKTLRIGYSNAYASLAKGNTFWVLTRTPYARAYTWNPTTQTLTRNASKDFVIAGGAEGGASLGNDLYILGPSGAVQCFDASGSGRPVRRPAGDFTGQSGTTIVGQASSTAAWNGLWIGNASGAMRFYTVSAGGLALTIEKKKPTLVAYTRKDRDRHKHFPTAMYRTKKRTMGTGSFGRNVATGRESRPSSGWLSATIQSGGAGWGNPTRYTNDSTPGRIAQFILCALGLTTEQIQSIRNGANRIWYKRQRGSGSVSPYTVWAQCAGVTSRTYSGWTPDRITHIAFPDPRNGMKWNIYKLNQTLMAATNFPNVVDANKATAYVLEEAGSDFGTFSRTAGGLIIPKEKIYEKDTRSPTITSFVSNPSEIDENSSPPTNITLSWSATSHTTLKLINQRTGTEETVTGSSKSLARPQYTTRFSLNARNTYGQASSSIVVPVFKDPVISALTLQYIPNPLNQNTVVVWVNFTVSAKPFARISIDNGYGIVSPHHYRSMVENTGTITGRIARTFVGPRSFNITLTATNIQANGVESSVTRTVTATI